MTIHLHQQKSAGNLRDNETIFIPQQGRWESWTSLHVFKCALHDHMDSWQANQLLWNSVRKQKMNYSTKSERICLWRVTLISAALHEDPCLGGKDSEVVSWWVFSVYFWVSVCGNFLFSCQTNYTDNKAIWIFLFLVTKIKIQKIEWNLIHPGWRNLIFDSPKLKYLD